jgi:hypothetical protein
VTSEVVQIAGGRLSGRGRRPGFVVEKAEIGNWMRNQARPVTVREFVRILGASPRTTHKEFQAS